MRHHNGKVFFVCLFLLYMRDYGSDLKKTKRKRELEKERVKKEKSGGKSKCESDRPDCLATK